jgi:predicted RNA binding protein YcfA (HicA-like mRNA interferase family)
VKIPRDCNAPELIRALKRLGYEPTRQSGSHIHVTTQIGGEHHLTIPNHRPLKVGMLHALLKDTAAHHRVPVDELLRTLKL